MSKFIKVTIELDEKESTAYVNSEAITFIRNYENDVEKNLKTVIFFAKEHRIFTKETKEEIYDLINNLK